MRKLTERLVQHIPSQGVPVCPWSATASLEGASARPLRRSMCPWLSWNKLGPEKSGFRACKLVVHVRDFDSRSGLNVGRYGEDHAELSIVSNINQAANAS